MFYTQMKKVLSKVWKVESGVLKGRKKNVNNKIHTCYIQLLHSLINYTTQKN